MQIGSELSPDERRDRILVGIGLLIALVSGYYLFLHTPSYSSVAGATEIGTLFTEKSVRIRHAKSLRWGTARETATIYLKDMIYTPKDTTAEFVWGDHRFTLEPDSLVQFESTLMDKLEINLLAGKVTASPSVAKSIAVVKPEVPRVLFFVKQQLSYLSDINSFVLKHSELSSRLLDVLSKKLDLEPMRGVITPRLHLDRLDDYKLVIKSPPEKRKSVGAREWFQLTWLPIPLRNLTYQLELTTKIEDTGSKVSKIVTGGEISLFVDLPGLYEWKLIAEKGVNSIETEGQILEVGISVVKDDKASTPLEKDKQNRNLSTTGSPKLNSQTGLESKKVKPKTAYELFFGK